MRSIISPRPRAHQLGTASTTPTSTVAQVAQLPDAPPRVDRSLRLGHERLVALYALAPTGTPWEGWRQFTLARKLAEGEGQVTFDLTPADGQPIPGYKAGQFLHVRLQIDGETHVRHYSMSDSAKDDFYRITIKRAESPAGSSFPPGKVSSYFIDTLAVGDVVDVKAPTGRFVLDSASGTPAVFLAGGIGVTPFLAMLNELAEQNSTRPVHLYYACSRPKELLRRDELRALAAKFPNIEVTLLCSKPMVGDKPSDYDRTGRINLDLLKQTLPEGTYEFYICGPNPMISDLVASFKAAGVSEEHVHFESFGSTKPKPPTVEPSAPERMSAARSAPTPFSFVGAGRAAWSPGAGTFVSAPAVNVDGPHESASIPLARD